MNNIKDHESYGKITLNIAHNSENTNIFMSTRSKEYVQVNIYESNINNDFSIKEFATESKMYCHFECLKNNYLIFF